MAHTFTDLLAHVVFGTKNRESFMTDDLKPRLCAYMGGIIRETGQSALAINGPSDHIHLLLRQSPTVCMADTLRLLKTNSSRWVHENCAPRHPFAWQLGYGAFSVSESNREAVATYIEDQEKRHSTQAFQDEFTGLLKKHRISYAERYLWE